MKLILKTDQGSSPIEQITWVFQAYWAFVMVFATCEFGEMLASQFSMFNDELDQCDWYLFISN